jgi:hypothetical protein
MNHYSTSLLLQLLVRLLLVQITAVKLKHLTDDQWNRIKGVGYRPRFLGKWALLNGICENIFRVKGETSPELENRLRVLLTSLFKRCPSGSGCSLLPVKVHKMGNYAVGFGFSKQTMWGDHPYADNRRQIIAECIDQLHAELQTRGYNIR